MRSPRPHCATYGYAERGNLTSADNQNITYSPITYDLKNRLTSIVDSNGKTISYQYNSLNQRIQMVADGRTIDYSYENGNRLYQVLSLGPVATITYDLAGRRQTLSYPNLVTTTYTPNKAGFLTNLLTRYNQLTTINSFAYTPEGMGNRLTMTDLAGVHSYTYDNTYQLTQATDPISPPIEGFDYDAVGNRRTATIEADFSLLKAHNYTYDWENKLVKVEYPYPGMANGFKAEVSGKSTRRAGVLCSLICIRGENTILRVDYTIIEPGIMTQRKEGFSPKTPSGPWVGMSTSIVTSIVSENLFWTSTLIGMPITTQLTIPIQWACMFGLILGKVGLLLHLD